jgi:hypothetical protein
MANWMEIIGVISAIVGLLVTIPTICLILNSLYHRYHNVRLCRPRLEVGSFVTEAKDAKATGFDHSCPGAP